jgi:hypothetical protein
VLKAVAGDVEESGHPIDEVVECVDGHGSISARAGRGAGHG